VADQIEGVELPPDLCGQFLEEHALAGQLFENDLLAIGIVPRA
jgi:hypothetical protein